MSRGCGKPCRHGVKTGIDHDERAALEASKDMPQDEER